LRYVAWRYRRIEAELVGLGIKLAASTVWSILKWRGSSRLRRGILECDFLTVDTLFLKPF
jgi:putative transposase